MALTGLTIANFPSDLLLDAGVVFVGSAKKGVTRGAPRFAPNRSTENVDFDGKIGPPIKGLHRIMHGAPTIGFTLLELGGTGTGNQIDLLEPGNTDATVTTVITHTPKPGGPFLVTGDYVADLRVVWERGDSVTGTPKYFAVYFPWALCTRYDIAGQNKSEALVSCEFEGAIDIATQGIGDAAYKLEYRTTLP
jgi:hypothetical protein